MKVLKLSKPYKFGDKEISEINFNTPKMLHLKGIDMTSLKMDEVITLGGRISDQPSLFFEQLEWTDAMAVVDVITDFLPKSPATGA